MTTDQSKAYHLISDAAFLYRAPSSVASVETELLFGEAFMVEREEQGFFFGKAAFDGYQGYLEKASLQAGVLSHTHRVKVLRTFRYSEPNIKSPMIGVLSMNAKIEAQAKEGRFLQDHLGGYIIEDHTAIIEQCRDDIISTAHQFIGAPYLWGGRQSRGLDCSALVQNVFEQAGHSIPRDSGPQEKYFTKHGQVIFDQGDDLSTVSLSKGDLVFWPGHVAMMIDERSIIHANGTHMMVTINPLEDFAGKIHDSDGPIRKIIRPSI